MTPLVHFPTIVTAVLLFAPSGALADSFPRQATTNIGCIPSAAILPQLSARDISGQPLAIRITPERASLPCTTTCFNGGYQYAAALIPRSECICSNTLDASQIVPQNPDGSCPGNDLTLVSTGALPTTATGVITATPSTTASASDTAASASATNTDCLGNLLGLGGLLDPILCPILGGGSSGSASTGTDTGAGSGPTVTTGASDTGSVTSIALSVSETGGTSIILSISTLATGSPTGTDTATSATITGTSASGTATSPSTNATGLPPNSTDLGCAPFAALFPTSSQSRYMGKSKAVFMDCPTTCTNGGYEFSAVADGGGECICSNTLDRSQLTPTNPDGSCPNGELNVVDTPGAAGTQTSVAVITTSTASMSSATASSTIVTTSTSAATSTGSTSSAGTSSPSPSTTASSATVTTTTSAAATTSATSSSTGVGSFSSATASSSSVASTSSSSTPSSAAPTSSSTSMSSSSASSSSPVSSAAVSSSSSPASTLSSAATSSSTVSSAESSSAGTSSAQTTSAATSLAPTSSATISSVTSSSETTTSATTSSVTTSSAESSSTESPIDTATSLISTNTGTQTRTRTSSSAESSTASLSSTPTEAPTSTAPISTSSASSSSTSSTSAAAPSYTPLGCYSEPTPYSPDQSRAMPNASTGALATLTVESCIDFCYNLGYPLAGVEHGDLCFCSDGIYYGGAPVPNGNSAGGCDTPCSGNSTELCGGHYLFDLYANPAFLNEFFIRFPMARFHAEKRKIGRYARRLMRYLE